MKKTSHTAGEGVGSLCTAPALGALLPDYVVELLNEEDGEAVENHLQSCSDCKQNYLTVIRAREAGRRERLLAKRNGQGVTFQSDVLNDNDSED